MPNQYVNKVQLADGTSLIDLSSDTAQASDVAAGKYFHLPTGERVEGTASGGATWTTLQDGNLWITSSSPNYILINNYSTPFASGETYRVTWGSDTFICETKSDGGQSYDGYFIGNPGIVGGTDDGSGATFFIYRDRADRAVGATTDASGNKYVKIEKQVSSGGGGSADLRSLTITSSYEKQVFDGENAWILDKIACSLTSNKIIYTLMMSLSDIPLVSGKTYAVTGTWERAGKSRSYTVDTSVTWSGSGTTVSISTFTGTFGVDSNGYVTFSIPVTSTDEDMDTNPLKLYFAADSTFDGFDKVTVNPIIGNVVTGKFKGTTTGAALDVPLNYRGSGYPVAVMVYPAEGPYNSGSGSFYSTIQRYASAWVVATLNKTDAAPNFSDGSATCTFINRYKSSSSSATSYSGSASNSNSAVFRNSSASSTNPLRIRSATAMQVFIASTSYGFMANIDYKYWVLYSS